MPAIFLLQLRQDVPASPGIVGKVVVVGKRRGLVLLLLLLFLAVGGVGGKVKGRV